MEQPPAPRRSVLVWVLGIFLLTAILLLSMGRTFFGPDGRFGLWEGDIWSAHNSQRFADPYSFSHVGHGILFFALLWLVARKLDVRHRLLIACALEAAWEVLENSPIIIERYRRSTIAQGYEGDSVFNSLSDLLMMALGFWMSAKLKPWQSAAALVVMELGCLFWVRDNLALNILMLIYPVQAIKAWQLKGKPS